MAMRYFLLIDGINGGSTDEAHRGWFDIGGYNLDVNSAGAGPGATGGAGAGRTEFSPLTVSLSLDTGLAELLQRAATGTHLRGIQIEGVTEGAAPQPVFDLTLGDVTVASVHEESGVNDSLVFDYGQIGLVTRSQTPNGTTETTGSFGFDLTSNRAIDPASLPSLSPGTPGAAPTTEPVAGTGAIEPAAETAIAPAAGTETQGAGDAVPLLGVNGTALQNSDFVVA